MYFNKAFRLITLTPHNRCTCQCSVMHTFGATVGFTDTRVFAIQLVCVAKKLVSLSIGCSMRNMAGNHMLYYGDDVALLAPSAKLKGFKSHSM